MDEEGTHIAKTRTVASILFPGEEWIQTEPRIWVATSRMIEREKEPTKWQREMSQVRILTSRGSAAYFLPERQMGQNERRCADIVLNGLVMEIKKVGGTRTTLGGEFRLAFKQGADLLRDQPNIKEHSVFIWLLSDLPVDSVRAKVAGELKSRTDGGDFICFFDTIGKLYTWSYKELRSIIGQR
jgi:hypothetical protein